MNIQTTKINDNVRLFENKSSLSFGTDAYLLSAYIRKGAKNTCELGAGSGVISLLALARNKLAKSTCVEIQESLFRLCQKNIAENGEENRMTAVNADLRNLPKEYNDFFDTVITNPPYMKSSSGKMNDDDSDRMCRHEINGTIVDFCKAASRILKYGGLFYAVYRPDRLSELLTACENNRLSVKRLTLCYPTSGHVPSIVLLCAKKGAAPGMSTTKPLIFYRSAEDMTDSGFTDEMKYIYEHGDFDNSFR